MSRKIISASRRSDIPALYSRWFLRRLEAGFCEWVHPFGGGLQRVSLRPEDCLAIVFWTRNAASLLPALPDLKAAGYFYYFHYTLIGYPRELETHNPELSTSLRQVLELAEQVGPEGIIWRYDPIILSSLTPASFHLAQFEKIATAIRGAVRHVYFSFVDYYGKTRKNFETLSREHGITFLDPEERERRELALRLRDISASCGMTLHACCEDQLLGDGIEKGRCVDIDTVRRLRPDVTEELKRRPTRPQCGCIESVDIGAYDTCPLGCSYCYATRNRDIALARFREHDPADTMLWRPPSLRGG